MCTQDFHLEQTKGIIKLIKDLGALAHKACIDERACNNGGIVFLESTMSIIQDLKDVARLYIEGVNDKAEKARLQKEVTDFFLEGQQLAAKDSITEMLQNRLN